jgi:hypothetical protein
MVAREGLVQRAVNLHRDSFHPQRNEKEKREIDCTVGTAPCLTAADDHGYASDEAEVVYRGLSPHARPRTVREYTL